MSETEKLAERLTAHVTGPPVCPSCGQERVTLDFDICGQELQCDFNRNYGFHTDSLDDAMAAKHDMLSAATLLRQQAKTIGTLTDRATKAEAENAQLRQAMKDSADRLMNLQPTIYRAIEHANMGGRAAVNIIDRAVDTVMSTLYRAAEEHK